MIHRIRSHRFGNPFEGWLRRSGRTLRQGVTWMVGRAARPRRSRF